MISLEGWRTRFQPYLVLVVALSLSALAWFYSFRYFEGESRSDFERTASVARNSIEARIASYENLLINTRAFLLSSKEVTPQEFRSFVLAANVPSRYPGLVGISHSQKIPHDLIAHFEKEMRLRGLKRYHVWPQTHRDEVFPIISLEPRELTAQNALGFDLGHGIRQRTLERARDTGEATISETLSLIQDPKKQNGFIFVIPVYDPALPQRTPEQRRRALRSIITGPIATETFFNSIVPLDLLNNDKIDFEVFLGAPSHETLVYDHDKIHRFESSKLSRFFSLSEMRIAGARWTLLIFSQSSFLTSSKRLTPWAILVFGVLVSFLLFGVSWLARKSELTQKRARAAAEEAKARTEFLYRKAQEAIEIRDDFISLASHELKTPLTTLKLQVQLLRLHLQQKTTSLQAYLEKLGKAADISDRQVNRLTNLIDEMLDVSRIRAGKLVLQNEKLDLSLLVQEVVERSTPDIENAGCKLEFFCDPRVIGHWDRSRIEQIVTNLVSNAIKYGAGKPIRIQMRKRERGARLEVQDSGIGIAPEDRERIFERFERAIASSKFSGLGLGLYLVRQIVDAHGGSVHLESEPGKGSTFAVELPSQA